MAGLTVEIGNGDINANALIRLAPRAPQGRVTSNDLFSAQTYWQDGGRSHSAFTAYLAALKAAATEAGRAEDMWTTTQLNETENAALREAAEPLEQAIIRATRYLSESFSWKGYRVHGRNDDEHFQALAWPRYDVWDREGRYVPSEGPGSIPREIQWATAEVAFYELENPNGLQPVFEANKTIQQVKAGSASVTFDTDRVNASGARPRMLVIADLIGEFLAHGAGNSRVGTAVRG